MDLDDLPSHRGPKKQKSSKASLPKVPKFTLTVDLDNPVVNVMLVQIVPPIQIDPPPPPQPKLLASLIPQSRLNILPTWF